MQGLSTKQLFIIIVLAIMSADVISILVFLFSRQDPNLRVAALVGTTNIAVAFVAIASTLLTGKDLTQRDPANLPPGSVAVDQTTTTTKLPPVAPSQNGDQLAPQGEP